MASVLCTQAMIPSRKTWSVTYLKPDKKEVLMNKKNRPELLFQWNKHLVYNYLKSCHFTVSNLKKACFLEIQMYLYMSTKELYLQTGPLVKWTKYNIQKKSSLPAHMMNSTTWKLVNKALSLRTEIQRILQVEHTALSWFLTGFPRKRLPYFLEIYCVSQSIYLVDVRRGSSQLSLLLISLWQLRDRNWTPYT